MSGFALFVIFAVPILALIARRDVTIKVAKNIWREIRADGGLDERARQIAVRVERRDYFN